MRLASCTTALLCAALFLALCVPSGALRSQELTDIKIASGPVDDTTPALYAIKAGIFKKYGLNVEISNLRTGAAIAAAVAGGSVQIGASSLMPIISAYAHGVLLPIVAPGTMYDTRIRNGLMVVRSDSPIKTARDLDGQTIGTTSLQEVSALSTLNWIDQNGGDSKTVKMLEVPYPAMLPALVEGRIAAGTLVSPVLEQELESGKVRVLANPKDSVGKHYLNSCWFTTADYAAAHPDTLRSFALAMREASAFSNANHAATVDLIAAFSNVDPATVARSNRPIWGDHLNPVDIQPLVDLAARYHAIDKTFDAGALISPIVRPIFH